MQDPEDPTLSVSMSLSQWQLILKSEPYSEEKYTPEGEKIFAAFGAIHQVVDPHTQKGE